MLDPVSSLRSRLILPGFGSGRFVWISFGGVALGPFLRPIGYFARKGVFAARGGVFAAPPMSGHCQRGKMP